MDMQPFHDKSLSRWLHLCKPVEMQIALTMDVTQCPNSGCEVTFDHEDPKPQWPALDPDDTK